MYIGYILRATDRLPGSRLQYHWIIAKLASLDPEKWPHTRRNSAEVVKAAAEAAAEAATEAEEKLQHATLKMQTMPRGRYTHTHTYAQTLHKYHTQANTRTQTHTHRERYSQQKA